MVSRDLGFCETQHPEQDKLQLLVTEIITKAGKKGFPFFIRRSNRAILIKLRIPKL